jgi:D-arabinose 5-phosphate isomerase GutQ
MFFVGDLVACLVHISDSESTSQVALALFRTVSMKAGRVRVTGVKASSLSTRADLVVTG